MWNQSLIESFITDGMDNGIQEIGRILWDLIG